MRSSRVKCLFCSMQEVQPCRWEICRRGGLSTPTPPLPPQTGFLPELLFGKKSRAAPVSPLTPCRDISILGKRVKGQNNIFGFICNKKKSLSHSEQSSFVNTPSVWGRLKSLMKTGCACRVVSSVFNLLWTLSVGEQTPWAGQLSVHWREIICVFRNFHANQVGCPQTCFWSYCFSRLYSSLFLSLISTYNPWAFLDCSVGLR